MAAIQTTLTLRDDISKRLKAIEKRILSLAKTMDNFNKGIVTSGKRMETLSQRVNKVATATKKLGSASKDVDKLNKALKQTKTDASSGKSGVDGLTQSVKRLATAYLSIVGIGKVLDTADTITGATNKLSTVYRMDNPNADASETKAVVQGQMDDIFASAQRSRSDYNATMQNVGKMLINAGDTFNGNLDKAIAFNELMAKSYTIGGASQKEQDSSMYQLIQALGSGTLAGDELRSVREGAQVAYKYIEEYAQKLYDTKESLKDLASKGMITSDIVTDAILEQADAINKMFDDTQVTFEQTWTAMKNNFVKAFEPVLQKLTTLLNNEDFQTMMMSLTNAFVTWANITLNLLEWISNGWAKINENIGAVRNLIVAVLIPALIALGIYALIAGIKAAVAFMIANWQLMLIISVIALLIFAFLQWGDIVGAVVGWIVGIVWGLCVTLYDIGLLIVNIFLGVVNAIAGAFMWLGALFSNIWTDLVTGFWWVVEGVLKGVKWIVDALNKIPGVSIDTGGLTEKINNAAHKKADSWAKRKDYTEEWDKGFNAIGYMEYVDPVEQGIKVGEATSEWVAGMSDKANAWLGDLTGSLPGSGDPFGGNDWETTIGNALDGSGTGENIGNIADSIELTKEDLEFLRELAEMEAINRFTTAEIKVDMSNYNTINGENDLDGLVVKLSEKIEEEMHIVAEGTY